MKFLTLSNSLEKAFIDDIDFVRCQIHTWHLHKHGYIVSTTQPQVKLHRFLLNCIKGDGLDVDHHNHNKKDNTRKNLRICTRNQNNANSRKLKIQSSKYKGVCWVYREQKFRATITVNYKQKHLGYFNSEILAAKIYDFWAKFYFKEFALTNF